MHFSRKGNVYLVSRITGPKHNLLGIELCEGGAHDEVYVEAFGPVRGPVVLSGDDVRRNVEAGLAELNRDRPVPVRIRRIQFCSDDTPPLSVYQQLVIAIIERLDSGPI